MRQKSLSRRRRAGYSANGRAWLTRLFGETFARRTIVAAACSLAIHEVVAGLIPPLFRPTPSREIVAHVTVSEIRVKPTPKPTPRPTPTPIHQVAFAHTNESVRVAPVVPKPEGKAAHKERIKREAAARPKPPPIEATPIWQSVPTGGEGAGAGARSGAGSLGNGTNGNGTGNAGTGAGGGGGPCGAVDFTSTGVALYDAQSGQYVRNNVKAIVHYADGSARIVTLDWPWYFKSEADDPFENTSAPMYFQFPPRAQRASEPPVVQYIMRYSNAAGHTLLDTHCPNIPPPGAYTPGP